jgi:hypothetical protein
MEVNAGSLDDGSQTIPFSGCRSRVPALQLDIATLYDERSALRCTHRLLYLFALHFTFYRWNSQTGDDVVVVASSRLSTKEDSKQPSSLIGNVLCEQAILCHRILI